MHHNGLSCLVFKKLRQLLTYHICQQHLPQLRLLNSRSPQLVKHSREIFQATHFYSSRIVYQRRLSFLIPKLLRLLNIYLNSMKSIAKPCFTPTIRWLIAPAIFLCFLSLPGCKRKNDQPATANSSLKPVADNWVSPLSVVEPP